MQSRPQVNVIRATCALIAQNGHQPVSVLACPLFDGVFLDLEAESVLGLSVGADSQVYNELHGVLQRCPIHGVRTLTCGVNVVSRDVTERRSDTRPDVLLSAVRATSGMNFNLAKDPELAT